MKEQTHIIHRLNIDIDVPDLATARHIYQNFSETWKEKILPVLDKRLRNFFVADESVRFERIAVKLCTASAGELEESISLQLGDELIKIVNQKQQQEIEGPLETVNERAVKQIIGRKENSVESFLYFLQYGNKPWYIAPNANWLNEEDLELAIKDQPDRVRNQLIELFNELPLAVDRLAFQFTEDFNFFIAEIISGNKREELHGLFAEEHIFPDHKFAAAFRFFLKTISRELIRSGLQKIVSVDEIKTLIKKEKTATIVRLNDETIQIPRPSLPDKQEPLTEEHVNGIYVSHAGLILLHPFLQYFFKEFDLLDENNFKTEAGREIAVHLLYFLATGDENPYEHELNFVKYLCGWSQYVPVNRFVELPEKMKTESANLLNSVIRHWKILKNTSVDGLRNSFLKRDGKLIITGQNDKLIIEKNGIDILLEHLPWSCAVIKLPWMKKMLYAEW